MSTEGGLPAALDALASVGRQAGVEDGDARAEGVAFAAALAESAPRAAQEWAADLGLTVQAFFDAAVRARRWRQAPTAQLAGLVAAGSEHVADYAKALVEVASAACELGEPTITVVANASVAAAAQLAAAGVRPPSPLPGAVAGLDVPGLRRAGAPDGSTPGPQTGVEQAPQATVQ